MTPIFTIYPAIDIRQGQAVRLVQGDPARQTVFHTDLLVAARRWIELGAPWLHVVNLDGAFSGVWDANQAALKSIVSSASQAGVAVQIGGGVRLLDDVERLLELGAARVILGTVLATEPGFASAAIARFGAGRLVAGIDARHGMVSIAGWQQEAPLRAVELATALAATGFRRLVYTDIQRDGAFTGVNLAESAAMAQASQMETIASGGVNSAEDIQAVAAAGLSGVIVGRALYEGKISPTRWQWEIS